MFCFDYHGDFDRSDLQIHNAHIRHVFQYLLQIIRRTVQFQLTSLNLGEKKNGIYSRGRIKFRNSGIKQTSIP